MNEEDLKRKIREHNEKVDYNKSLFSCIGDLICCLIFFPMIIMVIYRRGKYHEYKKYFD